MDVKEDILGNNCIEDVSWLCQLSESELDFLMSLKALVIQRAKVIRCEELVNNFDLKTLRALGAVLMENLKAKVKDSFDRSDSTKYCESLDKSNLLKVDIENVLNMEQIESFLYYSKERYRESQSFV
ncbi:hypothetical protein SAY86_007419 [Trapa natans]|uniref:Uncharacterized protein n=1 Tax=Trapa natans TaxID=22666 RepID=A0AAN7LDF5_TRANT|nr:hypothetical protein SAY86_007419 [Trapa natans]